MTTHYFDFAAATPLDETVRAAMRPYAADRFYNPSALYLAAQDAKQALESARKTVAGVLGAKPSEIIFTAGGTESDNLAVQGVMRSFPGANCVVSAVEHDAVLAPAELFEHKIAAVMPNGRIDLAGLRSQIDGQTVLISVMYANNEIGTVQPIAKIAAIVAAIRKERAASGNDLPLYLHTDACQAANYLSLLVSTLAIDLMTLNGGKIYGPKQLGVLYVRTGTKLQPLILGGGQERGYRSGTENVAGNVGFAAALLLAQDMREAEVPRLKQLQADFINNLRVALPQAIVNGTLDYRLPNNVHITLPGSDNERVMMELDEQGFLVATGSACSASSDEPSHVLKAIGLSDKAARSSLRISLGRQTTTEGLDGLVRALAASTAKA